MTSTDLAMIDPTSMQAQMAYAETIARSPLLPKAYVGQPASILIAMGLGQSIGITPTQSLYEIYVVNNRPSPSANLVASLVRRAGHKIRVKGDATSCTAWLVRVDDPDFTYEVTWTIDMARAAGLAGKDTWKSYPANMLRSRAIMDVCRAGAPEAMLGMEYAREELEDIEPAAESRRAGTAGLRDRMEASRPVPAVEEAPASVAPQDVPEDPQETGEAITDEQRRAIFAAFRDAGFTTDARTDEGRKPRLDYMSQILNEPVNSTNDLTTRQASIILDALREDALALASEPGETP